MKQWTQCVHFTLCALLLCCASLKASEVPDYLNYQQLLRKYVIQDKVDYARWSENTDDLAVLEVFLDQLAHVDIDLLSKADQTAYYINLYNAAMLHIVLSEYPIKSVTKIGVLPFSVFKKDLVQLRDRRVSLDEIEKGILLENYFDPRIHFALNCASVSCPPLRSEPFVGDQLEKQFNEQTRLFAQSEQAAQVDKDKKSVATNEIEKAFIVLCWIFVLWTD